MRKLFPSRMHSIMISKVFTKIIGFIILFARVLGDHHNISFILVKKTMKYIYTIPWRICVLKWPLSQLASWLILLSKKIRTMFQIKWSSKIFLFQNGSNVVTFSETDSSTTNEKSDGKYCLQRLNTQDSITVTYQIHY